MPRRPSFVTAPPPDLRKTVEAWTVEQVSAWISGLPSPARDYASDLADACIKGVALPLLCDDDLCRAGVLKAGPRTALLSSIETLLEQADGVYTVNLQSLMQRLRVASIGLCRAAERITARELLQHDWDSGVVAAVVEVHAKTQACLDWLERPPFFTSHQHKLYRVVHDKLLSVAMRLGSIVTRQFNGAQSLHAVRQTAEDLTNNICNPVIIDQSDPLSLQTTFLQRAYIDRGPVLTEGADWGFVFESTFEGIHVVSNLRAKSPVHLSNKVEVGDELIEVAGQIVIGWDLASVLRLLSQHRVAGKSLNIVLKKRPRDYLFLTYKGIVSNPQLSDLMPQRATAVVPDIAPTAEPPRPPDSPSGPPDSPSVQSRAQSLCRKAALKEQKSEPGSAIGAISRPPRSILRRRQSSSMSSLRHTSTRRVIMHSSGDSTPGSPALQRTTFATPKNAAPESDDVLVSEHYIEEVTVSDGEAEDEPPVRRSRRASVCCGTPTLLRMELHSMVILGGPEDEDRSPSRSNHALAYQLPEPYSPPGGEMVHRHKSSRHTLAMLGCRIAVSPTGRRRTVSSHDSVSDDPTAVDSSTGDDEVFDGVADESRTSVIYRRSEVLKSVDFVDVRVLDTVSALTDSFRRPRPDSPPTNIVQRVDSKRGQDKVKTEEWSSPVAQTISRFASEDSGCETPVPEKYDFEDFDPVSIVDGDALVEETPTRHSEPPPDNTIAGVATAVNGVSSYVDEQSKGSTLPRSSVSRVRHQLSQNSPILGSEPEETRATASRARKLFSRIAPMGRSPSDVADRHHLHRRETELSLPPPQSAPVEASPPPVPLGSPLLRGVARFFMPRPRSDSPSESIDSVQHSASLPDARWSSISTSPTAHHTSLLALCSNVPCKSLGDASADVDRAGWLYRERLPFERRSTSGWARRWSVLKHGKLYLYKQPEDVRAEGVLLVTRFQLVCGGGTLSHHPAISPTMSPAKRCPGRFLFKLANDRIIFSFSSDSQSDATAWMNQLDLAAVTYEEPQRHSSTPGDQSYYMLEMTDLQPPDAQPSDRHVFAMPGCAKPVVTYLAPRRTSTHQQRRRQTGAKRDAL